MNRWLWMGINKCLNRCDSWDERHTIRPALAPRRFLGRRRGSRYQMQAEFFLAEFPDEPSGRGEHELFWLPLGEAAGAFFHECHAWAAGQGLERSALRIEV